MSCLPCSCCKSFNITGLNSSLHFISRTHTSATLSSDKGFNFSFTKEGNLSLVFSSLSSNTKSTSIIEYKSVTDVTVAVTKTSSFLSLLPSKVKLSLSFTASGKAHHVSLNRLLEQQFLAECLIGKKYRTIIDLTGEAIDGIENFDGKGEVMLSFIQEYPHSPSSNPLRRKKTFSIK
jgi:hypothetical protein